jgi:HEAT repeat protein
VDFLRLCLDDPHIDVRRVAAQGLADLVGPADAGLLAGLAQDPDWAIRNEAARGLGRLRTPDQRAVLVNLARDLEPVVARTARIALGAEEPAEAASGP